MSKKREKKEAKKKLKRQDFQRQAKHTVFPSTDKVAKNNPVIQTNTRLVFSFSNFDTSWEWGSKNSQTYSVTDLLIKLRGFEGNTWNDLKTRHDHSMPMSSLEPEAIDRLEYLQLTTFEEIYRLRLKGSVRLWGIRTPDDKFSVLWWDPEHQVYIDKAHREKNPKSRCGPRIGNS